MTGLRGLWMGRLVVAMVLLMSACGGQPSPSATPPGAEDIPRGGTLKTALVFGRPAVLDPHSPEAFLGTFELHRCCLSRTLVSYVGRPTEDGGTELRPDLAVELPEVSTDGLAWTFRLKTGIHYGPPLQGVTVTAADIVRAIERFAILSPEQALFFYGPIVGVGEFVEGNAGTISGLETPDDETLIVRLDAPSGDLPQRFSLTASAPIPPSDTARLGTADGHDADFERFMVATGPYMFEGSANLDFTKPSDEQEPVAGYLPGEAITLVRNPSWDSSTDDLRPAYVDRIEIALAPPDRATELAALVDDGSLHLVVQIGRPPQAPAEQVDRYQADPELSDRLFVNQRDFVRVITMNLAMPPFDDVHVRRAANYAIDKAGLREAAGGPLTAKVAGHLVLDSLTDNLLVDYDPFATAGHRGDLDRAREEMRQSRYDEDGDGICDHPACQDLRAATFDTDTSPSEIALVAENLEALGIHLAVETWGPPELFAILDDPSQQVAVVLISFGKALPNAGDSLTGFSVAGIGPGGANFSLIGADAASLAEWGYEVTEVPNIDARLNACLPQTGAAQTRCWAELDQYLTEAVVPWVPYLFENYVRTVSARVAHYSFDQFAGLPALDQIAVEPDP